jgi:hypothetical protein
MLPTVRYDGGLVWYFGNERRYHDVGDNIVIKRRDLPICMATDLARAMRKARQRDHGVEGIYIDLAPDDEYWPKGAAVELISFVLLQDGRLAVRCELKSDQFIDIFEDDGRFAATIGQLTAPLLRRSGVQLLSANPDGGRGSAPYYHEAILVSPTRGKTLKSLYDIAEGIVALYAAANTGQLTRKTVGDLLAGGQADLLIGQPEGPWLDVKSAHYDLSTPRGKISLAEAVSRFANAEEGGLVVVGMGTKKIPGGELINAIKPVPIDTGTARRYRQAIETCIFPFPVDLTIRLAELSPGSGLVLVSLPPQEEELKPFLVHGAIVGDRIEGAYISIVRRSGEDSIPITAQQIHGTLAAGRALLRRGQLPATEQASD